MTELLSREEFRTALEKAMEGRQAKDASFSRAWAEGKLQRHHFARWAENHYHYVGPFADYMAIINARTPDDCTDARTSSSRTCTRRNRRRPPRTCSSGSPGLRRPAERVMDPHSMTPMTRGLQSWCYAIAYREHFAVATAALVVGLESQVPSIYRKQYPVLVDPDVYGFTEEEAEFFDLHITSDEVHGERGYQIVLDHANTPELQQRCLEVVRDGADMRFAYTKALYDTYVKPDLGEWVEPAAAPDRPRRRAAAARAGREHMPIIRFKTSVASSSSRRGRRRQPAGVDPPRVRHPLALRERELRDRPGPRRRGRRELRQAPPAGARAARRPPRRRLPPCLPELRRRRLHRGVGPRPGGPRRRLQGVRAAPPDLAVQGGLSVSEQWVDAGGVDELARSGRRSSRRLGPVVSCATRTVYALHDTCVHKQRSLSGVVLNSRSCPGHQWHFTRRPATAPPATATSHLRRRGPGPGVRRRLAPRPTDAPVESTSGPAVSPVDVEG